MSGLEYWGRVCRWLGNVALAVFVIAYMIAESKSRELFVIIAVARDSGIRAAAPSDLVSFFDRIALTMVISLASAVLFFILGYAAKKE